jgi:hypothetical protein
MLWSMFRHIRVAFKQELKQCIRAYHDDINCEPVVPECSYPFDPTQ